MARIGWVRSISPSPENDQQEIKTPQRSNTNSTQYGLGSMGLAMATNLQKHLVRKTAPSLIYSNRTMARGDALKALGGTPETSFSKLVAQCGIVFTMVWFLP